jgi:hypothetical protein
MKDSKIKNKIILEHLHFVGLNCATVLQKALKQDMYSFFVRKVKINSWFNNKTVVIVHLHSSSPGSSVSYGPHDQGSIPGKGRYLSLRHVTIISSGAQEVT